LLIISKHGSSDRSAAGCKTQQKSVTLDNKLDLMKYEHNKCTVNVANAM
jgi:hypothetical protein